MKLKLTHITKTIIAIMTLAVIAVCAILLPELAREEAISNPNAGPAYPFLIIAWIFATPIFAALYQTHKLFGYIDNQQTFTTQSVKALQTIKYASIIFILMIIIGATTLIIWAKAVDPTEDVTHIITISFIFTFITSIIATFIALLQNLLQNVIQMQSENELTI